MRIEEVKARLRSNKKEIQTFRKNLIGINNLIDQVSTLWPRFTRTGSQSRVLSEKGVPHPDRLILAAHSSSLKNCRSSSHVMIRFLCVNLRRWRMMEPLLWTPWNSWKMKRKIQLKAVRKKKHQQAEPTRRKGETRVKISKPMSHLQNWSQAWTSIMKHFSRCRSSRSLKGRK